MMLHLYTGILSSHIKKLIINPRSELDKSSKSITNYKGSLQTQGTVLSYLYDIPEKRKPTEMKKKIRSVASRGLRRGQS
jgi:hypothetical protein